jgi:hypothetical protein
MLVVAQQSRRLSRTVGPELGGDGEMSLVFSLYVVFPSILLVALIAIRNLDNMDCYPLSSDT